MTILLAIAVFGLLVPNGLFVYWLVTGFTSVGEVLANHLALGFILDAFLALGLLAYLFAVRPPGRYRWPWFVGLSILGGLGFGIPFYLWMNFRGASPPQRTFAEWWRAS